MGCAPPLPSSHRRTGLRPSPDVAAPPTQGACPSPVVTAPSDRAVPTGVGWTVGRRPQREGRLPTAGACGQLPAGMAAGPTAARSDERGPPGATGNGWRAHWGRGGGRRAARSTGRRLREATGRGQRAEGCTGHRRRALHGARGTGRTATGNGQRALHDAQSDGCTRQAGRGQRATGGEHCTTHSQTAAWAEDRTRHGWRTARGTGGRLHGATGRRPHGRRAARDTGRQLREATRQRGNEATVTAVPGWASGRGRRAAHPAQRRRTGRRGTGADGSGEGLAGVAHVPARGALFR